MDILYKKNSEIDKDNWDKNMNKCLNQNTYAYSWFLDTVCNNWDALISDDYKILMPLPTTGKFNLKVYQPKFIPKLGIYFSREFSNAKQALFLNNIPSSYKIVTLNFNKFNNLSYKKGVLKKSFYSIDLYQTYNQITKKYSEKLKSTLFNKNSEKIYITNSIQINDIIDFLNKKHTFKNVKDYDTIRRILAITTIRKLSNIYAAYSGKNELIGLGIFIISAYTTDLIVIESEENKYNTSALIIDKFIKTNSTKALTLNFEYSNENLIDLYIDFGAEEYLYEQLKFNRIPSLFKLFTKHKTK